MNLSKESKDYLAQEGIFTYADLKDRFEMSDTLYFRTPTTLLLQKLSCNIKLSSHMEREVAALIELDKYEASKDVFQELSSAQSESNGEDDSEVSEIDVDEILPRETLFIGVHIVKGSIPFTSLDDIIENLEQDICEELDVSELSPTSTVFQEYLLERLTREEWPCDTPLYISEDLLLTYPKIVTHLRKVASFVFRGN